MARFPGQAESAPSIGDAHAVLCSVEGGAVERLASGPTARTGGGAGVQQAALPFVLRRPLGCAPVSMDVGMAVGCRVAGQNGLRERGADKFQGVEAGGTGAGEAADLFVEGAHHLGGGVLAVAEVVGETGMTVRRRGAVLP